MTTKKQPEQKTGPDLEREDATADLSQMPKVSGRSPVAQIEGAVNYLIAQHRLPQSKARYDQRLLSIAATQFELGFLALTKVRALAGDDQPEEAANVPQE